MTGDLIGYYEASVTGENVIPSTVFSKLNIYLYEQGEEEASRFLENLFSWTNAHSPWTQWLNDGGKWPKRFAAAYKERYDSKLENDILGKIGDFIGNRVDVKDRKLYFEISKCVDWEHGSFEGRLSPDGKAPGTCWWNDWKSFRLGMGKHPDGFSVLLYSSKKDYEENSQVSGKGRCWLYRSKHGKVIFNAYGIHLRQIAAAIAEVFGEAYQQIRVVSPSAWINTGYLDNEGRGGGRQGLGFIIGNKEEIGSVREIKLPDFAYFPDTECKFCGTPISRQKSPLLDGGYVCETCVETRFYTCRKCHNYELNEKKEEYMVFYRGEYKEMCRDCHRARRTCTTHGKTEHAVYRIWHTQRTCCDWEIQNGEAIKCTSCGRAFDRFVTIRAAGVYLNLCHSCHGKLEIKTHEPGN